MWLLRYAFQRDFSVCLWRCFQVRLAFEPVDWINKIDLASVNGHHSIHEGLARRKRWRKGESTLSAWLLDLGQWPWSGPVAAWSGPVAFPCPLLLFSCRVLSSPLRPHGAHLARLLCPPVSPGVCSDSRPLSQWCRPTISSSAVPFSFCPPSFPASGAFPRTGIYHHCSWLLGLQTWGMPRTRIVYQLSWCSGVQIQATTHTSGSPGSPVADARSWDFSASIIMWVNSLQ